VLPQGRDDRGAVVTSWRNWSGSVTAQPRSIGRPSSEVALIKLIAHAHHERRNVRVTGSGHSFTPLCETDGILISLDALRGLLPTLQGARRATVWAGTKISQLGELLLDAGLALENQGDVDYQAVGGAISTGTHGTGARFGSLSTQVTALRIVLASGEVVTCSESLEPEMFKAAGVSLGLLGVISQVTLRLVPAFRLHERTWAASVEDCLAQFDSWAQANRHAEFFWVPGCDECAVKVLSITEKEPSGVPPAELAPPGTIARYVLPERIDWSCRSFPSPRTALFNEMEFAVPIDSGKECFLEIRELMLSKHCAVKWSVEYRTQKGDDLHLSPAYQRDVATISVHQGAEIPYQPFFNDVETVFRNHRGRPHWAKLHSHVAKELCELYPMWNRFHSLRERLDPEGRFVNAYLRGVMFE